MKYKFRCEIKQDAVAIKESLSYWIVSWSETPLVLTDSIGDIFISPVDLEVTFELLEDGPDLEKITKLIGMIIDCHVAEETVQLENDYTGERIYKESN